VIHFTAGRAQKQCSNISWDSERTSWVKSILSMLLRFFTGTQFLPGGHVLLPWLQLLHTDYDIINSSPSNLLANYVLILS